MIDNTSNYATKGAALGTSIPALALAALPYLTGGNGLGGLGGILGGGNAAMVAGGTAAVLAEKDSKIAELSAERYSDAQDAATYKQTLADNRNLREELYGFIKPIAEEAAANRERVAVLEATMKCENEKAILREQILQQKIDLEAAERKVLLREERGCDRRGGLHRGADHEGRRAEHGAVPRRPCGDHRQRDDRHDPCGLTLWGRVLAARPLSSHYPMTGVLS